MVSTWIGLEFEEWEEHTRVAFVGVGFETTFGDLDVVLRDDLVQTVFTTADDFAGSAMTEQNGNRG